MSYSKAGPSKVTLIDDLLDLDDDSPSSGNNNHMNILPNGQEDKYAKFIRQKHTPKYQEHQNNSYQEFYTNQQGIPQEHTPKYQEFYTNQQDIPQEQNVQQFQQQPYYQLSHNIPLHSPYSCLDIAGHIDNCPLCSKFYKNDKSIYIVTIILLVIICIILLKKVLEK
jgi:hypothetical protein